MTLFFTADGKKDAVKKKCTAVYKDECDRVTKLALSSDAFDETYRIRCKEKVPKPMIYICHGNDGGSIDSINVNHSELMDKDAGSIGRKFQKFLCRGKKKKGCRHL